MITLCVNVTTGQTGRAGRVFEEHLSYIRAEFPGGIYLPIHKSQVMTVEEYLDSWEFAAASEASRKQTMEDIEFWQQRSK
jgi:hypothetical protein